MSFLSRLFGSRGRSGAPKDIDAEISRLEAEAETALPGYVGTAFNRAGDLALKDGQDDRAVGYYGRAIDAFLEDAQRELARGVANKIIRVRPSAIRTLCTLTWLDLAARHHAMALLHLRDYASAAKDGGFGTRAATQIFEMGRLCPDGEFVHAAGDALDALGFPNRAEQLRGWAAEGGSPDAVPDAHELGDACLDAAIRSNDPDLDLLSDEFEEAPDGGPEEDGATGIDGDADDVRNEGADPDAEGEREGEDPDDGAGSTGAGTAADGDTGETGGKARRSKKKGRNKR